MATKENNNAELPLPPAIFLGFLAACAAITLVGLIVMGGYSAYTTYTERKLCIAKGGVWTYACYKPGDNSYELINVYEEGR